MTLTTSFPCSKARVSTPRKWLLYQVSRSHQLQMRKVLPFRLLMLCFLVVNPSAGSHTIGQAQCVTFRQHIYNETNINAGFASTRRRRCPFTDGDSNLAPLDLVTPNSFDNNYFKNLIQKKGLLKTDQVLFSGGSTDDYVTEYSKNRDAFYGDFASAMIKMGDIDPLTGSSGQIRRNCRVTN